MKTTAWVWWSVICEDSVYMNNVERVIFTKEMKKTYKILLPSMLPIHFNLLSGVLKGYGYDVELLKDDGKGIIAEGLKYVNNDICYPALLVIGQFISALKNGKYNLDKTALLITQTGGGCRASNYIHLLRKALNNAGFSKVPVISLNLSGLEKNPGFKITFKMIKSMIFALCYGDALMALRDAIEPYEELKGECQDKIEKWSKVIYNEFLLKNSINCEKFKGRVESIVRDFSQIRVNCKSTIKVGIVGEIYIKYSSLGNNHLVEFLKNSDCEVCVPGILNFILFKVDNRLEDIKLYGGNALKKVVLSALMSYLQKVENIVLKNLRKIPRLAHLKSYQVKKRAVDGIIGLGNKMGEGWLLTAEIIDLIKSGFKNIVCAQPFGCLPNHISGKGMLRKIRDLFPEANIVPLDYDPGASRTNQENRLSLMLAVARES